MDKVVFLGMAGLAVLALAAFVLSTVQQQKRIHRVEEWVKDYLVRREGGMPDDLRIHCSADRLWPVMASYTARPDGTRHRLQFACGGPTSAFALRSEVEEPR